MDMLLRAQTTICLPDADTVVAKVCDHLVEHNASCRREGDDWIVEYAGSSARITSECRHTVINVTAPTMEGLYFMRMALSAHLLEFASDPDLGIDWQGDGSNLVRPPNFTILQVVNIADLTPNMRRIMFSCEDSSRFVSSDALHLNLIVQEDDMYPQWPTVGPNGLIRWEEPDRRPVTRKYTVRCVDQCAGTIAIDFVRHADAGPGSSFAEHARVGDVVGALGPGGGGLTKADWYLFAGDETALPAIARMAENLPAGTQAVIIIEVADAGEVQALSSPADLDVRWLFRAEQTKDYGQLLTEAVRRLPAPLRSNQIYAWVGCEFEAFKQIRSHLRQDWGLKKNEQLVVSYWRKGKSEGQADSVN